MALWLEAPQQRPTRNIEYRNEKDPCCAMSERTCSHAGNVVVKAPDGLPGPAQLRPSARGSGIAPENHYCKEP